MQIYSFLEFIDLANIFVLSKSTNDLCEKYLWKEICNSTKFGKEALVSTEEGITYKERIKSFQSHFNSLTQKKARSNIGKMIVSEVHPKRVTLLEPFIANFLMKEFTSFCKSLFPNESSQKSTISFFSEKMVKYALKYGRIYTSSYFETETPEVRGLSLWINPYSQKGITISKLTRIGIGYSPFKIKWGYIGTLKDLVDRQEAVHNRIIDRRVNPHWTLFFIGVTKACQNKNIGSELLFPVLKSADELHLCVFTVLYQPTQEIVRFFATHDFNVVEKVPKSGSLPEFWCLLRNPK